MVARSTLTAIGVGILALGLLAPAAAQAAPSRPDGQAMVRVEGGTASAKKVAKKEYRIVVPTSVDISWMGLVQGRTRVGEFTPSALAKGWQRLGFRNGKKALTTLTWVAPGAKKQTNVLVKVTKPRINSGGQLTFLAYTKMGALPSTMPEFSINIALASPFAKVQSRDTSFAAFTINPDGSSAVAVTQSSNSTGYINWAAYNGAPACQPQLVVKSGTTKNFGGTCGNGHVDNQWGPLGNMSTIIFTPASNGVYGTVTMEFGYTPTGDRQFLFNHTVAQWDTSGHNTM